MNAATASAVPLDLMRRVLHLNLHAESHLHPSWLPAEWPVSVRMRLARLAPSAGAALRNVLVTLKVLEPQADFAFDAPLKRLLLLDGTSLRRLAIYTSLCAHGPLMRPRRNAVAAALRRQARRLDDDAVEFVLERAPELTALPMSAHVFKERPTACGRLLVDRGYRLLRAAFADEEAATARRLDRRLPRRTAELGLPPLAPGQRQQLHELMLACIIPERLPQWDWLF